MTVTTTISRVDYVAGGGVGDVTFPYPFKIFEAADLKVYVASVLKTLSVDYSVTGAGVDGGGNVVFVTAPGAGLAVAIIRDLALTQEVDYTPLDKFPSETHEGALDRLTMIAQQLAYLITQTTPATSNTDYLGKLAADPTTAGWGAAEGGRWWFNTTDAMFKGWNGADIIMLG